MTSPDSSATPAAFPAAQWCRSRRGGALCTRPRGHSGLHNRTGTGLMWSEVQADAPRCPASGSPAQPASVDDSGFPYGRALCPECSDFVALEHGTLAEHPAFRGESTPGERERRAAWFNAHGWSSSEPSGS